MKAQRKSSVSKLLTSFDSQLKNIIMSDLLAIRNRTALVNNIQNSLNSRLNAA
jgi:hypothetical protein